MAPVERVTDAMADLNGNDDPSAISPALIAASFIFGTELILRLDASGEIRRRADGRVNDRRSSRYLADLAAALILRTWESQGYLGHIEAGLPTADEAMKSIKSRNPDDYDAVIRRDHPQPIQSQRSAKPDDRRGSVLVPPADPDRLALRVLIVWLNRFAWMSYECFGADVTIAGQLEDALLDRMAQFLWRNRHTLPSVQQAVMEQSE